MTANSARCRHLSRPLGVQQSFRVQGGVEACPSSLMATKHPLRPAVWRLPRKLELKAASSRPPTCYCIPLGSAKLRFRSASDFLRLRSGAVAAHTASQPGRCLGVALTSSRTSAPRRRWQSALPSDPRLSSDLYVVNTTFGPAFPAVGKPGAIEPAARRTVLGRGPPGRTQPARPVVAAAAPSPPGLCRETLPVDADRRRSSGAEDRDRPARVSGGEATD